MTDFQYDKYVCVMFPYPSGSGLHVGHWWNYAVIDSYCRYQRYLGNSVFQPFGYDSFGLPAENYARKIGGDPRTITYNNIDVFRDQMDHMDTQYEELFCTSDPQYVQKTQWLFKLLYDKGLAYKAFGEQDWCPSCETVLAREQVKLNDGLKNCCERCGSQTEKKTLKQWYLRITDYKDRLIKNLDWLDYPEGTKKAQRVWLNNQHDWCVSRQRKWGCPIPIEGEEDTLDTFVDSSFYFLEYCWGKNMKAVPVDLYVGGSEHACMHLIYARFITMFLYDMGVIDFEEPFKKVIHQGMILNKGEKISKSKGNTVGLDNYDSDEIRFYLMFMGHYFDGGSWDDKNINGIKRFVRRFSEWMKEEGEDTIDVEAFKAKIFAYTESFKFNKVVSEFMILYNSNKNKKLRLDVKGSLIDLLQIYMPGIKNKL